MMRSKQQNLNFIHEWMKKRKVEFDSSKDKDIPDQISDIQHIPERPVNALEPIAITGLSGFFPGCMDIQSFWTHIDRDESLITEIPMDRFDWKEYYDPTGKEKRSMRTKWGGFIPDIASFDPRLFHISPLEAGEMDPRQRLLLMSTWRTLEDAGIDPLSLKKSNTGVFIGCEMNEYAHLMRERGIRSKGIFNQADNMNANRISYHFDFSGPSEIVNTMCSGFAVALHRAVVALHSGEIDRAIVGAANIMLLPEFFIDLSQGDQMSTQKTVKSFGKNGDGYIRSEGVGTILIERLSDAKSEHRYMYAIIKHTAVNYNGQGGMSMASPNTEAHTELIKTCYQKAKIDPRQLTYIEAQGMGLPVADIAEWTAMNRALTELCQESGYKVVPGYCRVSTLKPMAGHMQAASSLGALLKIIRSFQTKRIHKVLDYTEPNEFCDMENTPCRIVADTESWEDTTYPRLAAFHSYGSGGNNAHIVLEEYPRDESDRIRNKDTLPVMICLSARTEDQLKDMIKGLHDHLVNTLDTDLIDLSFTLNTGRHNFGYRCAIITESIEELIRLLNIVNYGDMIHPCYSGKKSMETIIDLSHQANKIDINNLAIEWVKGTSIKNVSLLYSNQSVQRLTGLPGYSFEKKRYWFQNQGTEYFEKPSFVVSSEGTTDKIEKREEFPFLEELQSKERRISPSTEHRPELSTPYVNPQNDTHVKIIEVWQTVLGIENIGINDNFSELGGNSLLGIPLINELNKIFKVKISIHQFYENLTIKDLALLIEDPKKLRNSNHVVGDENIDEHYNKTYSSNTYDSKKTPNIYQEYHLSNRNIPFTNRIKNHLTIHEETTHFNIVCLFDLPHSINLIYLEEALRILIKKHDTLRIRFYREQGILCQQIVSPDECSFAIEKHDLSGIPSNRHTKEIENITQTIQCSFKFEKNSSLIKVAYLDLDAEQSGRLFICLHHYILDGFSFELLVRDLEKCYLQLLNGETVSSQSQALPVRIWLESQYIYANSEAEKELQYWQSINWERYKKIPIDFGKKQILSKTDQKRCDTAERKLFYYHSGVSKIGTEKYLALCKQVEHQYSFLSSSETSALLQKNENIIVILILCLVQAFEPLTGNRSLYFNLVSSNRFPHFINTPLNKTLGSIYDYIPFPIDLINFQSVETQKDEIIKILANSYQKGLAYQALKFSNKNDKLKEEINSLPNPEVNLNVTIENSDFYIPPFFLKTSKEYPGKIEPRRKAYGFILEVKIVRKRLNCIVWGEPNKFKFSTTQQVGDNFMRQLRTFL